MKITSIVAVAVSALTLTVAGCGSSTGDNSSSGGAPSNGAPITLKFQSLAYQAPTVKAMKDIVASWNQAHPDIQVQYVQGDWDSVQDKLVTQFQGNTAPDIIQYEAASIGSFADQGYLADLSGGLTPDVKGDVSDGVWKTVTVDGKIVGAPILLQSYMVFANTDLLKQAGVSVPTGDTWSWDDFQNAAKATTKNGVYGVGWGLGSPTATLLSMGLNFGGTYFQGTGTDATVHVGANELALPERIHQMAYDDKSLDPVTLSQAGSDVMTGFLKGKYAMTVQGSFNAETLAQSAPKNFHWAVLPILAATTADQAADPQTLSVSAESSHQAEATQFIDYFMQAQNLAKVAEGDWLIPPTTSATKQVEEDTKGANGWSTILASGAHLTEAPFQTATNYEQWKDQIATPAFQKYLGDKISTDDLTKELQDGWQSVNGG